MSSSLSHRRFLLVTALLSLATACREPSAPAAAPRATPPRMSPDAPGARFDLSAVIRRAHFAYRPEGSGWTAGHSTWSARVTPGGLTFTPRHTALELTGTPVTFGALTVSRGGVALASTASSGTVSQDGALTLSRGVVEEQLQNREDGIEQRWRFARLPEGEGELLLRVPVKGLRFAGETAQGLHFADASGLGVRYSHAAWTDAAGKKTELTARAVAGAVEFRVPAALLAASSFPVLLAPAISPEFGLDTPVTDPGGGSQTAPAMASNGTDYFAVWADDRGGDVDVYGARVSQSGTVLDSLGIPIGVALNAQQAPAVAFDGTNYLVVWSDGRRGSGSDIYGARVSPAGSVLDPSGLALSTSTTFTLLMSAPALAFDGTNYLIIWDEKIGFSSPTNLQGLRVSPAGSPVGSPFVVSNAVGSQLAASVAFDGLNSLAVWQDDRAGSGYDIYAARISTAGAVLDGAGFVVSNASATQANPAVAFNGTLYLVAWEDSRNQAATGTDLYGARVTTAGGVLDAAGLALVQAASTQALPALARLGTQCVLAWQDLRSGEQDVYAARLDANGAVLDGSGVGVATVAGAQSTVAIASNGTNALLSWNDSRTADIVGARVSAGSALTVLDASGFTVSRSANSETNPAVAFDGTNYLVVWQDNRGSGFDLYGVRVSGSGSVLDPAGFAISSASGHQRNPAVAFNGTQYLVAWEDTRVSASSDIYAARVTKTGMLLDPSGVPVCPRFGAQEHPAVAFDGSNYLVVWDDSSAGSSRDIYGTRVSTMGTVLDPTFVGISTDTSDQSSPAIAFDGTNYLVAWSDYRNNSTSDVYGARVSRGGTVQDTAGLQFAGGTESQTDAALAFDGTNYLLAWTDYQTFPSSNLGARRIRPSGVPADSSPITVSAAAGHQQQPSVVYTGTEFLLAWQDGRGGTGLDIYAGRVTSAGVATDGDGFVLSANAATESQVALASAPGAGVLAVYQVTDTSLGSNVQRLKARWLGGAGANTPPEALPQSLTTEEDVSLALELTGTDAESTNLTYAVVTAPLHGALTGTLPKLRYVPQLNYNGPDSFTFTASDGQATSAPATITITITPVNDAPTATAQVLSTPEETARTITLAAFDPENDAVTFALVTSPSHGTLTGTPPSLTYTPEANYSGPDSFTFTASDSQATSAPGTITINVTPVNDPPTATARSLTTPEDTALPITLTGTDPDGDTLSFVIAAQPTHGTVTGTPPNVTYVPAANYSGLDSFTFTASDGQVTSAAATVTLSVGSGNDAPVVTARSLTTAEDTALSIMLTGTDVDGDTLTFAIGTQPAHGTLTGTAPDLTYTPAANYFGPDSFTFTASDGTATSSPASVSITVTPVNDAPVATARLLTTPEDTPLSITLTGTDAEGDALTFALVSQPSHGRLTGTPPNLTYTPDASYHGADSFTFTASDGTATSAPGTLSLFVASVNSTPVVSSQSFTREEDTVTGVTLEGTDADGDTLTFTITVPPAHGALTGTAPNLTYTPALDYFGTDSFTFTATDGLATSAPATVSFTLTPVNDAPRPAAQTLSTREDTAKALTLTAVDPEGAPVSFTVVTGPSHGTLTGTPPALTYTPAQNYQGPDSFTFTASDGVATSAPATVTVNVTDVNDTPVAQAQTLTVPAGSPSPIYLSGSDVDGDELTFAIVSFPEQGKLTGTPPDLIYTPPTGFTGSTRFTFSANDGRTISSAEIQLTVEKRSLTVSAAVDTVRPADGQQVRFYANAVDERGADIALQWDFGDGQTSSEELPVHSFAAPGTYDVKLQAKTATETATTLLRVRVRGSAATVLTAGATGPSVVGVEGSTLALSLSDPNAPGRTYSWDFGDGTPSGTGTSVSHTWADDGRFTVKVTGTDGSGTRTVATRTVIIHNTPPVPLPQEKVSTTAGKAVSVSLSGSDAAGPGDPLRWELVSGEGALSSEGTFTWTPSQEGLSTIITKVIDGDGGESRLAFQVSTAPVESPDSSEGCGCGTSAGGAPGALGLALLLLSLAAMRRRGGVPSP